MENIVKPKNSSVSNRGKMVGLLVILERCNKWLLRISRKREASLGSGDVTEHFDYYLELDNSD